VARAVEIRRKVLGPEHPDTAQCVAILGALEVARGRFDEADKLLEQATPVLL
jgi:hypothetical protein